MILFFANQGASYSYAFFVPAAIFFLNMLFLMTVKFPDHHAIVASQAAENAGQSKFLSEPKFSREGIALVIIGFTSTGLFTVAQIWLPSYGEEVLGMAAESAVKLLSYYSIGALISVLSLSVLLKKTIRPVTVIVVYPIITFIAIMTILTVKIPSVAVVTAFFIGFSTAGIFQLAITIMTELFWRKKGTVTGIVATAAGLASIVMPLVTGLLSESGNIAIIFIFDALLALIGFFSAAFVYYRYGKLVNKSKDIVSERRARS
jgi:fucose permease